MAIASLEVFEKQIGVCEWLIPWFRDGGVQNEGIELCRFEFVGFLSKLWKAYYIPTPDHVERNEKPSVAFKLSP